MLRQKKTKKKMMTWKENGVRELMVWFRVVRFDDTIRSRSKELKSFFGFEAL